MGNFVKNTQKQKIKKKYIEKKGKSCQDETTKRKNKKGKTKENENAEKKGMTLTRRSVEINF